ncbi:MAG TPA: hypothetical protein VM680_07855, partial [Verrucomicrobiae bacterium]|nr:hypothetical protein [Verrucomicrobiae bacterium]
MTLVETVVAVCIASLVMAVMAQLSSYTARSLAALANYTDLDRMSRNALDQMSAQIRQTRR